MKSSARKSCIANRNQLSKQEMNQKNKVINNRLITLLQDKQVLHKWTKIGLYMPIKNEVDIREIHSYFDCIALPKVISSNEMIFYEVLSLKEVSIGSFQILEPVSQKQIDDLDVIIVPIVGFDKNKHRIGYGKGYYDRYLAHYTGLCIGVAYECQKVKQVTTNEFDRALDYIISEACIYE